MLALHITDHVSRQLSFIFNDKIMRQGEEKAKKYIYGLQKSLHFLAYFPDIAIQYEAHKSIYYLLLQHHVVYFLRRKEGLIVISILHQSCLPIDDPALNLRQTQYTSSLKFPDQTISCSPPYDEQE